MFGTGLARYEDGFAQSLDLLPPGMSPSRLSATGPTFAFREVSMVPRPWVRLDPPVVAACTSAATAEWQVQRWNLPEGWVISSRPAHPPLVSQTDFVAAQNIRAPRGGPDPDRRYRLVTDQPNPRSHQPLQETRSSRPVVAVLAGTDPLGSVEVALVINLPSQEVPGESHPLNAESLVDQPRLSKGGFAYWRRFYQGPVGNHHVRGPVTF